MEAAKAAALRIIVVLPFKGERAVTDDPTAVASGVAGIPQIDLAGTEVVPTRSDEEALNCRITTCLSPSDGIGI